MAGGNRIMSKQIEFTKAEAAAERLLEQMIARGPGWSAQEGAEAPGSLPGRPEMKSRNAHCEIESPLSAYRNRLQCNGAIGAADQHVSS